MKIIRAHRPSDHFTIVANKAIRDAQIPWDSLGLLVWLLSHKEGWETSERRIAAERGAGRHAVRSMLAPLEEHGYLSRDGQNRNEGGKFGAGVWYVSDQPTVVRLSDRGSSDRGPADRGQSDHKEEQQKEDYEQRTPPPGASADRGGGGLIDLIKRQITTDWPQFGDPAALVDTIVSASATLRMDPTVVVAALATQLHSSVVPDYIAAPPRFIAKRCESLRPTRRQRFEQPESCGGCVNGWVEHDNGVIRCQNCNPDPHMSQASPTIDNVTAMETEGTTNDVDHEQPRARLPYRDG